MSNTTTTHYLWNAINRFGAQAISFFGNVIIARKLLPDDFGLVASLAIFVGIALNIADAGFDDCLIRKADADEKDFATIFVYNISLGITLFFILFFLAPIISLFFHRPELTNITRVLSLSIVLQSLTLTQVTRLRKNLQFKRLATFQILSVISSVCIGIALAFTGFGYWALVALNIAIPFTMIVMLLTVDKWRPKFYFSWQRYKEMREFSVNLLISYLINQIGLNSYSVFIGRFYSTSALGYYNQGTKINDTFFQSINAIILTTSYPLLAAESDRARRKEMYKGILRNFMYVQFNISFFIIGSATFLIPIIFGDKWLPTAIMLKLLVVSFLLYPLTTINSNIIKIEGKAQLYRNLTFLRIGLSLLALSITCRFSIEIMLFGQIASRFISVLVDVYLCGKTVEFRLYEQSVIVLKQVWVPLLAMLISNWACMHFSNLFVQMLVFVLLFFAIVIITNFFVGNEVQKTMFKKLKGIFA